MDLTSVLKNIAPTVATALLGPLGGSVLTMLGNAIGVDNATQKSIETIFTTAQLTPDQLSKIKELELQLKNDEAERQFKYSELVFEDVVDARKNNVASNMQDKLLWLSIAILFLAFGSELYVLINGYPTGLPDVMVGRILGSFDGFGALIISYWFGTSLTSAQKTTLLAQAEPIKVE